MWQVLSFLLLLVGSDVSCLGRCLSTLGNLSLVVSFDSHIYSQSLCVVVITGRWVSVARPESCSSFSPHSRGVSKFIFPPCVHSPRDCLWVVRNLSCWSYCGHFSLPVWHVGLSVWATFSQHRYRAIANTGCLPVSLKYSRIAATISSSIPKRQQYLLFTQSTKSS